MFIKLFRNNKILRQQTELSPLQYDYTGTLHVNEC